MPCKFFDSCPHRSGWCNSDYVLMKCNYGLNRLCDERIIKIDTLQKENAELKRLLKLSAEDANDMKGRMKNGTNWIPVSERLPEQPKNWIDEYGREWNKQSDDFIITDDKGRVYVAGYTFCEKRFWYNYSLNKVNAVAWMPLPEPYVPE